MVLLESPERSFRLLLLLGHVIRSAEKDVVSSSSSETTPLALLALDLISHYASFSLPHQVSCALGGHRSVVSVVASLPVFFLTRASLKISFFSAVIAMTYNNRPAFQLLLEELSEKHLLKFITGAKAGDSKSAVALNKITADCDFDSLLRFYSTQVSDE
ncbi:hypothetical protein OESDEN_22825 [Oesophagostomum dentatum]|uniref:Uncharacterized protein n=1 Tax=Oesophagostomum dentatum TaxID=61180 RepID=A0A0B1S2V7_OESDE|nr:hypothetical protein OESDEN_22825 [Oesophagostomum dentatum]